MYNEGLTRMGNKGWVRSKGWVGDRWRVVAKLWMKQKGESWGLKSGWRIKGECEIKGG